MRGAGTLARSTLQPAGNLPHLLADASAPLSISSLRVGGTVLSTRPGGRAGGSGRPAGRPPLLQRAHPFSHPPAHLMPPIRGASHRAHVHEHRAVPRGHRPRAPAPRPRRLAPLRYANLLRPPAQARPRCRTANFPQVADANSPFSCEPSWARRSSSRSLHTRPELLRRLRRCGRRQRPSADRLRKLRRTAPALSSLSLRADGSSLSIRPGVRAGDSGRPAGRPPFLQRAHPISHPPAHLGLPRPGPRTVQWRIELSPALRPGSCPPLAPAGAAQTQGGASGKAPLPEPRPARHSPPPGCAFT
jgi:hypothetical protein